VTGPSPGGGRWRGAEPELAIAGVTVAVAALAAGAVAGWPGVATVAIAAAALSVVVLAALAPRPAEQVVRLAGRKQGVRSIDGYGQRRFVVTSSFNNRAFYESDLRPALEHVLAARLAENHGVNLYTDPARARTAFCRDRGDEILWSWVDPEQALRALDRDMQTRGIPYRTLARLVNRLEQL